MSEDGRDGAAVWADALCAATLFVADPVGTVGVSLRAQAGPVRDRWLQSLRGLLPADTPVRRVPLHIADSRLLGGLDLAATLKAGRPVAERGVLAECDGGVLVIAMAERVASSVAARIVRALDSGEVRMERDGFATSLPARFGVVVLDEGISDEERPPAALADRLAFPIDLDGVALADLEAADVEPGAVADARSRLPDIRQADDVLEAICGAAMALGIRSVRAPYLALRAARAAAALAGRGEVSEADAALAARLVLAPRAERLPEPDAPPPDQQAPDHETPEADDDGADHDRELDEIVLDAASAAIPADLLVRLRHGGSRRAGRSGRAGATQISRLRGRPAGTRRGMPRGGARLNVIETLRAAAPWQRLRQPGDQSASRIQVRQEDFRITRHKECRRTTTIFVVDASGSSAFQRLAEAKGAVELLLSDCYIRRDQVALIAFRDREAELLLPPTRSLVRAKRSLAALPGGGGTPLAAGIEASLGLADAVKRRGETPVIVLLTDGRANIARDGTADRPRATEDALAAARGIRAEGLTALMIDTSPRPEAAAGGLAEAMGATYVPLPHADAAGLSAAVRAAALPGLADPMQ